MPKCSPTFGGLQEASRDWEQSPPQSSGLLQGRIREHSLGGGVRLSIRPKLRGRLRCDGSGHMFPRVWPRQLLQSVACPPARGSLLGAGHACTLRLALSQMPRPPEGWRHAVWPTPLHKQLRPLEPHSSVAAGAPSGHPGAQAPPGCAELSRGLEAEPDLTPALVSPSLHGNIVGPDCMWGCCWS